MAFFERATANRKTENTRAGQVLVKQLARSAENYVLGRFLQEIAGNSTNVGTATDPVFQPATPASMAPERLVSAGINSTTFPTLVRQSIPSADPNASNDNTAAPAANGRAILPSRWDAPRFHTGNAGFSAAQTPNWIYLQKDGTTTASPNADTIGRFAYNVYETGGLLDANVAGHPSSITGQDLQDIKSTLAGADLTALPGVTSAAVNNLINFRNPGATTAANYKNYIRDASLKGFLSPNPGTWQANFFTSRQDLIRYATKVNPGLEQALPYLTHFSRASNAPSWGPETPAGSIINYAANANSPTAPNRFLPNVKVTGTFTRADGTTAQPGEPLLKNRFPLSRLAGLGWNGINASGNTTLVNGQPSPASAATIQRDFGLQWDNANNRWNYVGHTGSTLQSSIKTLHQVAQENREPNFFELLKAGILQGSLSGGTAINSMGAHLSPSYSRNSGDTDNDRPLEDYHILQIGANIIDQFDADSFPTAIAIGGSPELTFYGIEDLPYLSRAYFTYFRLPTGTIIQNPDFTGAQPSYRPWIRGWLRFDLWNPHRQTSASPSGNIRVVIEPKGNNLRLQATNTQAVSPPRGAGTTLNLSSTPQLSTLQTLTGSFSASSFRNNTKFDGTPSQAQGSYPGSSHAAGFDVHSFTGFWLGDLYLPHISPTLDPLGTPQNLPNPSPPPALIGLGADASNARINLELSSYNPNPSAIPNAADNPELRLEIQTPDGWRTYQRILNFTPRIANTIRGGWFLTLADLDVNTSGGVPSLSDRAMVVGGFAWAFFDPRSQRFGFPNLEAGYDSRAGNSDTSTVPMNVASQNLIWGAGTPSDDLINTSPQRLFDPSYNFHVGSNKESTHVEPEALGFLRYRSFAANNVEFGSFVPDADGSAPHAILDTTSYRDADHIQRRGDNSPATANDFYTDDGARPVVLNRAFRSVGELAAVFRDTPWRTLDLSSSRSPDGALAEIFSVNEEPGLSAGKVNINTAPADVLRALIANTTADAEPSPDFLPPAKADAIRDALLARRTVSLFPTVAAALAALGSSVENPSGLVQASGTGAFNNADVLIKTRRDALARAFSDVAQVGNWVLFCDIISQSGRFANNTFVPEAEDRTWLTFSLQRNTAKITAQHREKIHQ